jgi:enamine deaminase RidA (YjgF/YER057c/UK114 family)
MTSSPVFSRTAVTQGRFETIYTAGLTAPEGTPQKDQAKPVFSQLKSILDSTGSDLEHLSKATYYVSNPDANKSLDTIRPTLYDPKRPPSASKAGVSGVMPGTGRGMLVDMIAIRIFK